MSLNGFKFLVLFIALFLVLFFLQILRKFTHKKGFERAQIWLLLLFSFYFVAASDIRFLISIIVTAAISYSCGILIKKYSDNGSIFLIGGGVALICILGYFKYTNFFIESIDSVFNLDFATRDIILPLGISFYTFSALAYLIDVYRGDYEPEKNVINFFMYICFFSKVTAGPIVRGKEFFPQVHDYKGISKSGFEEGIQIFCFGLFKKMVIADHLGVFVDDVFHAPVAFNTGTVIWAALSYSLQIYFDFSGYSDMAIGLSKICGFDFSANFNLPYIATDVSDFWKRWHISLSSWLKDYLYIPLGGSRKGETRTYLNLLIVMFVSGLWHGAGWTFILWGVLYGVWNCIHQALNKHSLIVPKAIAVPCTFVIVSLLWVIFRATSFGNAAAMFKGMFTAHTGISQPYTWTFFAVAVLVIAEIMAWRKAKKAGITEVNGYYPVMNLSKFWNLIIFFTFIGLTIILGYYGNTAFIYGKF